MALGGVFLFGGSLAGFGGLVLLLGLVVVMLGAFGLIGLIGGIGWRSFGGGFSGGLVIGFGLWFVCLWFGLVIGGVFRFSLLIQRIGHRN